MDRLAYRNGRLFFEDLALEELANTYGTPAYVYSRQTLVDNYRAYADACSGRDALICYSVKSNSNLAILQLLARLGSGFDIVSGGELLRVIAAGGAPERVIFSGVGKSDSELALALEKGIKCFNVESVAELHRLNRIAHQLRTRAPVSLRVNPDVDAKTHPYISTGLRENKFGISFDEALPTYRAAAAMSHIDVVGIDCHIGSQLLDDAPLLEALDKLIKLIDQLLEEGIALHHLDIGGGLGIRYGHEEPVAVSTYLARLFARIDAWRATRHGGRPITVLFEPGRSISGNAGLLLTRVQYIKPGPDKNFAIVDAAMNDLMRPAMYEAWHGVKPLLQKDLPLSVYDVVGPVCESSDWLARQRELAIEEGDLLAILSAGAYGMTMASNYNTRPRGIEILVDGADHHVIRARETVESLFASEQLLP